jgi:hypothetical protein
MLYALFAAFTAATMVSVMMTLSLSSHRTANTTRQSVKAKYLAEGAIEVAKRDVANAVANFKPVPQAGTTVIDGVAVNYDVTPTGFSAVNTQSSGIQTMVDGYEIRATATSEGHQSVAHRLINSRATPIFQFAVFYTDDLEINPGPNMTLRGRVHSNGDMYLNCNNTLTVNTNYVHAVGGIYRHRKDDPSKSQGTVRIRQFVEDPYDPLEPLSYVNMNRKSVMTSLGVPTTSGYDSNFTQGYDSNADGDFDDPLDWYPWASGSLAYWSEPGGYGTPGNTIQNAPHGIGPAAVPQIGSIMMFEPVTNGTHYYDTSLEEYLVAAPGMGTHSKGYYHDEAGLSIITHKDGTISAYDENGVDVTAGLPTGTLRTRYMYDARQAEGTSKKVLLTQLDLSKLAQSGSWPSNGLIYSSHYDASTGFRAKGLRLKGGSELASPLSIVSANSIYVWGDYNTVNKKGAAVIGDAVNLLSNAWNNSKVQGSGLPDASDTTFNTAIITGNHETVGSGYNGGLENLPRFHEKWSGKTCTIAGSFVNTWYSQYATGKWAYGGDRYTAPGRDWEYDTMFNNVANLPPYTPMAVSTEDVAVW